ncbi:YfjI family protein [Psychrobacter sp. DD43]|uniref:YfjI family protein n=1 Tax=Psychrobacter sp. DD43 TaxID=2774128 RepID=UPI00191964E3|nr:YfjI family protein [Psychrobacter sp. DD43]
MTDVKDNKTHGKVGLTGILGDYPPATVETLAGDDLLTKLHDILEPESLLYINTRIAPNQGDYVGEKLETENSIGLVLHNKDYEPVSLICITPNSSSKPIITDTNPSCAFIIGRLDSDYEIVAVNNLHDGIELASYFIGDKITIIVSPNDWLFADTVKHFAQDTKVTIFTTLEEKNKLSKQLAGTNVKLVIPVLSMLSHVEQNISYTEVLSYDDTQLIDLQGNDWADPKPISHTLPPVTSITPNMLPETLYSYVINTANRLSVPLEFVAVPLVVALGSVIGTKVSIFPKRHDDWQVIPNLWGAVIGQPSSKKSPAMDNAMKPIDNLISKAMKAHKSNMKEHATQTLINTAKAKAESDALKSLAKQLASQDDDTDSTEKITEETIHQKAAAIAESKQQDENIPIPRRHMVSDITVEKLGEIENQNNNGVLQYRDELSGFLASLEKDSEQQARSFYLEGFNGTGSYTVDRIMRGSLFIENHCVSVMGGIQPDKLEMYLEKTMRGLGNDGLIQRFQMMVYPDPLPRTKEKDMAVDKESRDAVYSLFIAADELNIGTLKGYGANEANKFYKRPHFRFTDDAYKVFMSWLDDLNDKADNAEHDVIAQHLMKYGRLIPALALIFHLVDCIEHRSLLGGVSLNALQAAIAWGDMLETHMLRVYSCITDNSHLKASLLSKKILEMLKKPSDKTDKTNWVSHGFTARSLKRKNWKGLTDDEAVQTALDVLIEYDWLNYEVVNSTGQGGRPTERYWINPKLKQFI